MKIHNIQLTEEDRAKIRENAALLRRDEADPSVGLYSRRALPCVVNPTIVNIPRWRATSFPPRSHSVIYTTHEPRDPRNVVNVSGGFRWVANKPWFPTEENITHMVEWVYLGSRGELMLVPWWAK